MTDSDNTFDGLADNYRKKSIEVEVPLVNGLLSAKGTYSDLIKPVNAQAYVIQKDRREIVAREPILVRRLVIETEDPAALLRAVEVEVELTSGVRRPLVFNKAAASAGSTSLPQLVAIVNDVCRVFHVRAKRSAGRVKATRIVVYGYSTSQLDGLATLLAECLAAKASIEGVLATKKEQVETTEGRLESAEEELAEIESGLVELRAEKAQAEAATQGAKKEQTEAQTKLGSLKNALNQIESQVTEAKNNAAQLGQAVSDLNKEIAEKKGQLQKLVNDKSLISDEFVDYVKEGKTQARHYLWLCVLLTIVLGFCAWQLYSGADRILSKDDLDATDVAALFMQRLPFAAAIALIAGFAWKLQGLLVARIMKIHSERLTLARLLVIAKDTVYSSSADLSVEDDVRFRERIRLKLEMLKSHLTSELGPSFQYQVREEKESPSESDRLTSAGSGQLQQPESN